MLKHLRTNSLNFAPYSIEQDPNDGGGGDDGGKKGVSEGNEPVITHIEGLGDFNLATKEGVEAMQGKAIKFKNEHSQQGTKLKTAELDLLTAQVDLKSAQEKEEAPTELTEEEIERFRDDLERNPQKAIGDLLEQTLGRKLKGIDKTISSKLAPMEKNLRDKELSVFASKFPDISKDDLKKIGLLSQGLGSSDFMFYLASLGFNPDGKSGMDLFKVITDYMGGNLNLEKPTKLKTERGKNKTVVGGDAVSRFEASKTDKEIDYVKNVVCEGDTGKFEEYIKSWDISEKQKAKETAR